MRSPENKLCQGCEKEKQHTLDPEEIQTAITEAFGDAVFVEMDGLMTISIGKNVELEINTDEMEMTATAGVDLQSHEPMQGEPDYDRFIDQISVLPRLSALLLKSGFAPKEWRVNEFRGPGNGACSVLMTRPVKGETVAAFVREVREIKELMEALDA